MIEIGGKPFGEGERAFMIAEVGINHNGDLKRAMEMVEVARDCGADAVKFQTFKATDFCAPGVPFTYTSQGRQVTECMLEMFQRHEFSPAQWHALKAHCEQSGILFLSTPQNPSDLELLLQIGVPLVKVGSDDFVNLPLLRRYAETRLPLLLSCGMADLGEVEQALHAVGWHEGYPLVLLVCTSSYPTPPEDVNIARVRTLQQAFPGLRVGFSDHSQGAVAAGMAYTLGARVFEKHFTLSHDLPGPDHWFSADPQELTEWIGQVRQAEHMLGSGLVQPSTAEREMRTLARRSLVAIAPVAAGEPLTEANLGLRRPGSGLPPAMLERVLGRPASRPLSPGTVLQYGDVQW